MLLGDRQAEASINSNIPPTSGPRDFPHDFLTCSASRTAKNKGGKEAF